MISRSIAFAVFVLICNSVAAQETTPKCPAKPDGDSGNEACIGVALAGGGTKAASVAMGVLTGFAQRNLLDRIDAISSVSGGTYAAYFYFSKLREVQRSARAGDKSFINVMGSADFFRDCIPRVYRKEFTDSKQASLEDVEGSEAGFGMKFCRYEYVKSAGIGQKSDLNSDRPKADDPAYFDRYRFQTHVRCRQDVFDRGECKFQTTAEEDEPLSSGLPVIGTTLLTVVPVSEWLWPLVSLHHFSRTLFDWPINTSPMRLAYRQGLGATFGLYPNKSSHATLRAPCTAAFFANCDGRLTELAVSVAEDSFTVGDLKSLHEKSVPFTGQAQGRAPLWFINSTATPSRSVFGWAAETQLNMKRDVFEIHAHGFGSEFYGRKPDNEIPAGLEKKNVLDTVNVSAAFLDSNLQSVTQPWRLGAALGLHALNASWGLDIPNYNVGAHRRLIHSVLPFPLYYTDGFIAKLADGPDALGHDTKVDSAWIRLIDGGQSENLGAYALIRRGYGYVLIADGAQDSEGRMQDVCHLRLQLLEHHGWQFVIPGLQGLDKVCLQWIRQVDAREVAQEAPGARDADFSNTGLVRQLYKCQPEQSTRQCMGDADRRPQGYRVREWTQPFLVGCVLDNRNGAADKDSGKGTRLLPNEPDFKDCNTAARRSWIVLVKPAFDFGSFSKQLDEGGSRIKSCGEDHSDNSGLPCEASAYLMWNPKARDPKSTKAVFPQHSTLWMTLDSSYTRYGAYKDLMRSHTVKALSATLSDGRTDYVRPIDPELFKLLVEQEGRQVPSYPSAEVK